MPRKAEPPPKRGRPVRQIDQADPVIAAVGETIRRHREAAGLTIDQAATEAGIPRSTWGDWEAGVRLPRLETVAAIAAVIGCQIAELVPQ